MASGQSGVGPRRAPRTGTPDLPSRRVGAVSRSPHPRQGRLRASGWRRQTLDRRGTRPPPGLPSRRATRPATARRAPQMVDTATLLAVLRVFAQLYVEVAAGQRPLGHLQRFVTKALWFDLVAERPTGIPARRGWGGCST